MDENPYKLLENDEELQALQSICTKANKNTFIKVFQKKVFKIAVHKVLKEAQSQYNNKQKVKDATIASNAMLKTEIDEATKYYNTMVSAIERNIGTNMSYMKELILSAETKSKIIIRLEKDTKNSEELLKIIKEKCDRLPLVQEWRDMINEEKNRINKLKSNENLRNTLILELKQKQKEVAELDKQKIIKVLKFMLEERPQLLRNIKEKETQKKKNLEIKKQNLVIQNKCIIEKQPLSSQNVTSAILSPAEELGAMWRRKYTTLTRNTKSDVKEDSFFSSYMKYFNSINIKSFKETVNKPNVMDILEDLPSEKIGKSEVHNNNCGIENHGSSNTRALGYGTKKIGQVERTIGKDQKLVKDIKVATKNFLDNYENKAKTKLPIQESKTDKEIKDDMQLQDGYKSQGDATTKSKNEDVAMREIPQEKSQHFMEGNNPTEPSKVNVNDNNFFENCYKQYLSTSYNAAKKGSVQKDNKINILEDLPVNNRKVEEFFLKLKVNALQAVDINKITKPVKEQTDSVIVKEKEDSGSVVEEIPESLILPPTMFIDSSQTEEVPNECARAAEIKPVDTQESINDDESYRRQQILLNSNSPDFVYARNCSLQKGFTTSKYFIQEPIEENKDREINVDDNQTQEYDGKNENSMKVDNNSKEVIHMDTGITNRDVEDNQQVKDKKALPKKISPNESMNTTMDEMDSSHYIDSNLLLSPKADDEQNVDESSNFLSGIKKPEMSFFGNLLGRSSDKSTPEPYSQNPGLFNFNFGGRDDDKKKGGGNLFNLFN